MWGGLPGAIWYAGGLFDSVLVFSIPDHVVSWERFQLDIRGVIKK